MNSMTTQQRQLSELTSALDFVVNGLTTEELEDLMTDIRMKQLTLTGECVGQVQRDLYNGLTTLSTLIQTTIFVRSNV